MILAGTMSSDDLTKFVSDDNLLEIYGEDVTDYTQQTLANFHTAADALVYSSKSDALKVNKLKTAISIVDSLFDDEYQEYTIANVVEKASDSADKWTFKSSVTGNDSGNSQLKALLTAIGYTYGDGGITITSKKSELYHSYSIDEANSFTDAAINYIKAFAGIAG